MREVYDARLRCLEGGGGAGQFRWGEIVEGDGLLRDGVVVAAAVDRVVVAFEEAGAEVGPCASTDEAVPCGDGLAAAGFAEGFEFRGEVVRLVLEVAVFRGEKGGAGGAWGGDFRDGSLLHGEPEGFRDPESAQPFAFRLDPDWAAWVELAEGGGEEAFEVFLGRLGEAGFVAEEAAAVAAEGFEVEHLGTGGGEEAEDAGFSGSGETCEDVEVEAWRVGGEVVADPCAPVFVAAAEDIGAPADGVEDGGHAAGALAAAPAVDEEAVAFGSVSEERAEVAGDVAGYGDGTAAACFEAALLAVDGADFGAFGVVEDREVDGVRQVVLGEFRG